MTTTVKEAAARLGVSPSLVYALIGDGVIAHTRHGRPGKRGCIRIEESEVERYREDCKGAGGKTQASSPLKHITPRK